MNSTESENLPMDIRIQNDPDALWLELADWLEDQVLDTLTHQSEFHMAIPGGSTPASLFRVLAGPAGDKIPWSSVHIWWTDERCVPPDDPRSNYGLAKRELFKKRAIPDQNIHRIKGELEPRRAGVLYAIEMEDTLCRRSTSIPFFDLVMLGVGTDGHVASLFPNGKHEDPHPWSTLCEYDGVIRVSLPYEVIGASSRIAFLVTGRHKADIVYRAIQGNKGADLDLPASIVCRRRPDATWFLDQAAAQKIESKQP